MFINDMFKNKKAIYSFEIFPPKSDSPINSIYNTLDEMASLSPDFISVTYSAGGTSPGNLTAGIARDIKNKYNIEPLAHLTCANSEKSELIDVLEKLKGYGIQNILALRGDIIEGAAHKTDFRYASNLISFIKGKYDFNIVSACYPEGHPETSNINQDIKNLKNKADKGATHLITQLFFNNDDFYNFMYQIREEGITLPVQAGIMPVTNKNSIRRIISLCGAAFPKKFVKMLSRYEDNPEALFDAGIYYATEQIIDLLSNNVAGIHLYTMNNPKVARRVTNNIKNILNHINNDGLW
ncbi:MAG: methylenetetrahydrofolate reductase [NAD(P)H] [Clostridiales bacterium]|jgi:methylenetetrahydrofolate reductase (NADPH)|nr:methylenetetrahydrofolate reductase [NAD(P)H] [Clostridiales bacterium]